MCAGKRFEEFSRTPLTMKGMKSLKRKMSANSRVKGVMVPFKNFVFFMVRSCCLDTLATAPTCSLGFLD